MTSSRVEARLDADAQRKLAPPRSNPFSILRESGFIGCGKKTPKHARGRKGELTAAHEAKYGRS